MGVKISDLPSNSQIELTDVFPENHSGTTYKTTLSDVKDLFDIPEVDGTLTVSGAAADAKAAGDRIRTLEAAVNTKAPVIVPTASGSIATITDGADDMPMTSVAVSIAPVQSGSGDPSPDNIRPISGWTEVNVTRAGKNLLPNVKHQVSGTNVRLGNSNEYSLYLPKGTYTLSIEYLNDKHSGAYYRLQSDTINRIVWPTTATATSGTLTIDKDEPFTLWLYQPSGFSADDVGNFWLELGSTATAYEPYAGNTYTIQLGDTVYGGTLDVTGGKMVVDRAMVVFDGGSDETWAYFAVAQGNMFRLANYTLMKPTISVIPAISNAFNPVPQGNRANGTISSGVRSTNVDFIFNDATSLTEWREWLAENNVQFCYELATPIEITLTPTEIRTLLGDNTVYADAGAVDVQYPADTKLYIDAKIAELQALVLENNG